MWFTVVEINSVNFVLFFIDLKQPIAIFELVIWKDKTDAGRQFLLTCFFSILAFEAFL